MEDRIEEIEARRLQVLEEQAALHGPLTPPHLLIEIAELMHKKHTGKSAQRRQYVNQLDYDFVMNVVAAALIRLGALESELKRSTNRRDLGLILILIMVFAVMLILIFQK